MKIGSRFGLLIGAGFSLMAVLSGCGGNNGQSIPASVTVFDAHTAVLRNFSTLTTGYNGFGQLGNGNLNSQSSLVPVAFPKGTHINAVAVGAVHTVALSFDNISTIYSWGSNYHGQIGSKITVTGSGAYSSTPVTVTFPGHVTAIAAGGFHTLAVVGDTGSGTAAGGTVYAVGYNGYGQLGDNTFVDRNARVKVQTYGGGDVTGVVQVAAGGSHSLALTTDGRVYAWGNNANGQIGINPNDPTANSTLYRGVADFVQVHTDPTDPNSPMQDLTGVTQIAAGGSTSFALQDVKDSNGNVIGQKVYAWGYNGTSELGSPSNNGANDYNPIPTEITFKSLPAGVRITKIVAGLGHVLALDTKNTVWAWGFNQFAQLGNNTLVDSATPIAVLGPAISGVNPGLNNATATDIMANGNSSLAMVGGLWYGWGDNGSGQLGNPVSSNSIGYFYAMIKVLGF